MIKLFLKFILGIMSLPVAVGCTIAFYNNVKLVQELAKRLDLFIWGIAAYVVLHLLFYKPTYLYVWGHEMVHAGIGWLFGARVKSVKVSEGGGSVGMDKTNTLIELGPYFFPLYAVIITLVYFILISSYSIDGGVFIFMIGFALAFHLVSTIEILKIRQPDLMKSGYVFSIVFVFTLNIVVIAGIFSLVFPAFSMKRFFIDSFLFSRGAYQAAVRQLFF